MKKYIENACSCIITKSLMNGETKLRWLFREEPVNNIDTGWMAFGDKDNDFKNFIITTKLLDIL